MPEASPVAVSDSRHTYRADGGYALSEALVATLVLTSGLLAMAQLINIAVKANSESKTQTMTSILADQKMEELRALAAPDLSPADALQRSTAGFVDYIDAFGAVASSDTQPPRAAVYTRRWSVAPLAADPNGLVIRVRVTPTRDDRDGNAPVSGEARVFTIKLSEVQ